MKNLRKFIVELVITIVVALLLSLLAALILGFAAGNAGVLGKYFSEINMLTGVIFGLIVGYKLNTLVRENKKK